MASFKQMTKDGTMKRADAEKIRLTDIHIEPGFNLSGRNDSDDEDDAALFAHIMAGGMLPDLEVRPREMGGVWIVDGHRRYTQMCQAVKAGAPIEWVSVVQFVGNDVERTLRLMTSNENKKLTALQIAEGYARLARFGLSAEQIAERFHKTRQHVDQLLILAGANHDVHQAVKDCVISATEAVNFVRKHGEMAGAFIRGYADKAGGKVTAKAVKPWMPPAKIAAPLIDAALLLSDNEVRISMMHFNTHGDFVGDARIPVRADRLHALLQAVDACNEAMEAADQKARDKAAKAAKMEIEQ